MASKVQTYVEESYNELMNKVTWPSWTELQSSALLVATAAIIFAFIVFVMDFIVGIRSDASLWKGLLGFFYSIFE